MGPPIPGIQIRLTNWEEGNYKVTDKPRPRGEVIVGGKNISAGYYKLPGKTEEEYFVDEEGTRWFRTGDIGTFETDGTLRIIDRKKDLVRRWPACRRQAGRRQGSLLLVRVTLAIILTCRFAIIVFGEWQIATL